MARNDPTQAKSFLRDLRLAMMLMRDAAAPFHLKLLPLFAVLYLIFPEGFAAAPFSLPLATPIDDIAVFYAVIKAMVRLAPPELLAKYEGKKSQASVVEGNFEMVEEEDEFDDTANNIFINPQILKED